MNTVGNRGLGESVWLGWFLASILTKFAPLCSARREEGRAERYRQVRETLTASMTLSYDSTGLSEFTYDPGTSDLTAQFSLWNSNLQGEVPQTETNDAGIGGEQGNDTDSNAEGDATCGPVPGPVHRRPGI